MNARILLALLALTSTAFAASSFVVAVDASGSMKDKINGTPKFDIAKSALSCMFDSMKEGDEGAIFVFEDMHTITMVHGFTTDKNALKSAARSMTSEFGGTDLKGGINESSTYALANAKNANKFIIVLSDGGSASAALNQTAAYFHNAGISRIQVVGLSVKDNVTLGKTLAGIAANGGGAFYSTFDYASPCDAMKGAYFDGATETGGGKCCPALVILPLLLAAGLLSRWHA